MQKLIKINEKDNVAVAIEHLNSGDFIKLEEKKIKVLDDISLGHKVAIEDIKESTSVVKYGEVIGIATENILKGRHVHVHNIKTTLKDIETYEYNPNFEKMPRQENSYFWGYERENGKVGVRNEIWVIPTVGCMNGVALEVAEKAKAIISKEIDGVVAFPHPYGCSQMGEDQENTKNILSSLINHPNAGGVLVLGLGCENSNITELKKIIGKYNEKRVKFVEAQEHEDEVKISLKTIMELSEYAMSYRRKKISVERLVIGLKCGGSDGLSGITANPTVGKFSDIIIRKGGSTILTEVPEMFGAEKILMNRCENEDIFTKVVDLIVDFKEYFIEHNQVIYENPSPGNKEGGISTLEDKSLGCTQKAGTAIIKEVIKYGETIKVPGLNLLNSPGNDLVATTALAAAGAQIVLFTTGRGTPFGGPVPTVKISSNTELKNKKNGWIDFDCGKLLSDQCEDISEELFDYVIEIASGKKVKAEERGYHDIAIFKKGVTL